MLFGLTYQLMRFITDLVLVRTRSDAQLRAEVLALRHQPRCWSGRSASPPDSRLITLGWRASAGCSRVRLAISAAEAGDVAPLVPLSGPAQVGCLPPRPPRQRPVRDPELGTLTVKLAEENPRWGYRRIHVPPRCRTAAPASPSVSSDPLRPHCELTHFALPLAGQLVKPQVSDLGVQRQLGMECDVGTVGERRHRSGGIGRTPSRHGGTHSSERSKPSSWERSAACSKGLMSAGRCPMPSVTPRAARGSC